MESEPPRPPEEKAPRKHAPGTQSGWRYVGLGVQLTVTVAVFVWAGKWLQERFGWPDWSRLAIAMFGVVAGLYHFVRESQR